MREHLSALGDKSGSPAGANPLVTQILALEDEMARLRRRAVALEEQRTTRREVVSVELEMLDDAAVEAPR